MILHINCKDILHFSEGIFYGNEEKLITGGNA